MKLSEAKAVVTGGASGLGYATAQRVVEQGGQVVLLDVNDELGTESAAKLGERAGYISTDVSSEASVKPLSTSRAFGPANTMTPRSSVVLRISTCSPARTCCTK